MSADHKLSVPFETIEELLRMAGQIEAMGAIIRDDRERKIYNVAANVCRLRARELASGDVQVSADWENA